MTIISCIKQVYDLDIVLKEDWIVNEEGGGIDIDYANRIINTFDQTSLEIMLRLKDKHKIMTRAITLGDDSTDVILRKALSLGVDQVVRINTQERLDFMPNKVVNYLNSYLKALVIEEDIAIIMCGRQADNASHGQTGQSLAAMLGWPCLTMVIDIEKVQEGYRISRIVDEGIEHVIVDKPLVVTITQSENKLLRMATLRATLEAKKKPIQVHQVRASLKDRVGVGNLEKLTINQSEKKCQFIEERDNQTCNDQLVGLFKGQLGFKE